MTEIMEERMRKKAILTEMLMKIIKGTINNIKKLIIFFINFKILNSLDKKKFLKKFFE